MIGARIGAKNPGGSTIILATILKKVREPALAHYDSYKQLVKFFTVLSVIC